MARLAETPQIQGHFITDIGNPAVSNAQRAAVFAISSEIKAPCVRAPPLAAKHTSAQRSSRQIDGANKFLADNSAHPIPPKKVEFKGYRDDRNAAHTHESPPGRLFTCAALACDEDDPDICGYRETSLSPPPGHSPIRPDFPHREKDIEAPAGIQPGSDTGIWDAHLQVFSSSGR